MGKLAYETYLNQHFENLVSIEPDYLKEYMGQKPQKIYLMENTIENKVAQSGLIQLDLETIRIPGERIFFDIKPLLFMDLVLKEKDFRAFLVVHSWEQYQGKHVAISCSSDAIIPTWAFMLLSAQMSPFASTIVYGNLEELEKNYLQNPYLH